jgi:predicted MFS family arabinose efflux permease
VLLAIGPRYIPADRVQQVGRRSFDIPGAVTLTAGMLLLVRTIVEAPNQGWGSAETIGGFALALALLGAFVAIEQRSSAPLVRLGILRSAPLVRANLGMMVLFGAYVGFQFVITLYLQATNGWSPVETALAFLPAGLLVAVGSPRIGPLVDRFGPARVIAVGATASLLGYALILRLDTLPDYAGVLLPTMLLIGIGFMLLFPTFNIQATAGVENHEQGLASGLVQTSFQVGGAIGLAIVTAVVAAQAGSSTDPDTLLDAYRSAIGVAVVAAAIGVVVALTGLRSERRARLALVTSPDEEPCLDQAA